LRRQPGLAPAPSRSCGSTLRGPACLPAAQIIESENIVNANTNLLAYCIKQPENFGWDFSGAVV
jgi:hypothetical protein